MEQLPHICLFGTGRMARQHAKLLRKLFPKIALSFAGRDPAKAQHLCAERKGQRAFESFEQAAAADEVDVVLLATPHALHAEQAELAAAGGKHLIIEKPICRSPAELERIERAVERHGVRCTVAENYFYKPALRKIRGFIDAGLIGQPLIVALGKTTSQRVDGWRSDAELMGGGALLEGGIHWVDALLALGGSAPVEVMGFRPTVEYATEVPLEDTMVVQVRFANGCLGTLTHSWKIPNRFGGLGISKVYGSEGVVTFESNGLFLSVYGRKNKLRLVSPRRFLGFRDMLRAFVDDYRQGRPWQPDLGRIRQEMAVVWGAYRSLDTHRPQAITDPAAGPATASNRSTASAEAADPERPAGTG